MNQHLIRPELDPLAKVDAPRLELKSDFRDAMSKLGAAVNIVTTDGPAGRAGFAATAVCSVSDDPPMMLVCLNRASSAYAAVTGNGVVCINVLAAEHESLSRLFGGKTPVDQRFAAASWSTMSTGAPALDDALASLDCRVRTVSDGSSHDILICEVQAIRQRSEGQGLLYFNRQYHTV
jgi:flavin reductase